MKHEPVDKPLYICEGEIEYEVDKGIVYEPCPNKAKEKITFDNGRIQYFCYNCIDKMRLEEQYD